MERATVALPEGGSLALPIAGLGSRLWARVVDALIQVVGAGAVPASYQPEMDQGFMSLMCYHNVRM